jgi:hypothetical protein
MQALRYHCTGCVGLTSLSMHSPHLPEIKQNTEIKIIHCTILANSERQIVHLHRQLSNFSNTLNGETALGFFWGRYLTVRNFRTVQWLELLLFSPPKFTRSPCWYFCLRSTKMRTSATHFYQTWSVTCYNSDTPVCNWLHGQRSIYKFRQKGSKRSISVTSRSVHWSTVWIANMLRGKLTQSARKKPMPGRYRKKLWHGTCPEEHIVISME